MIARKQVFECTELVETIVAFIPTPMLCRAASTNKCFAKLSRDERRYAQDIERLQIFPPFNLTARDAMWRECGDYCYDCGDWSNRLRVNTALPTWLWMAETDARRGVKQYQLLESDLYALFYGHGFCARCACKHSVIRVADKDLIPPWASSPLHKRYLEPWKCWLYSTIPRSPKTSIVYSLPAGEEVIWRDSLGICIRTLKRASAFDQIVNEVDRILESRHFELFMDAFAGFLLGNLAAFIIWRVYRVLRDH